MLSVGANVTLIDIVVVDAKEAGLLVCVSGRGHWLLLLLRLSWLVNFFRYRNLAIKILVLAKALGFILTASLEVCSRILTAIYERCVACVLFVHWSIYDKKTVFSC